jgi:DNA helicase II / ATP-dependent DNA helicase PcrA
MAAAVTGLMQAARGPIMLDLSRLSPAQRQVALAPDGPLLVVAGPGSGKTTALTARIAVLVTTRAIPASSVLALTFTTAAARELRVRLAKLLGDRGAAVQVCTFHSFGLRLIREWSRPLGFGAGPVAVYGAEDARRLLRQAAADVQAGDEEGYADEPLPLARLAARVDRFRLRAGAHGGAGESQVTGEAAARPEGGPEEDPRIAAVARRYEALLLEHGAVDFASMLALPQRLFEKCPDALRHCREAHRVLLCDEFQDACPAQYRLVRRLVEASENLTAVGDPRQTIYGWRGADVRLLLAFQQDFPGARILTLDQNFRSTGRIVAFANALGAPLEHRRPLWTDNEDGAPVVVRSAADDDDEATFIAGEIACLCGSEGNGDVRVDGGESGVEPGDIAVLYRTNRQADRLTLALRARGVPYAVWGGGDLFARREVRDIVAYLRLAHNPDDRAALARIVDAPPRGLAPLTLELRRRPVPLRDLPALVHQTHPHDGVVAAAAGELAELIRRLHGAAVGTPLPDLVDAVLERTGYRAWLQGRTDGQQRLEHVAVLHALAGHSDLGLGDWLAALQLGEADDPAPDRHPAQPDPRRVTLTTVHAAKGKEWPIVFVAGVEEGLLPHARALREGGDEEPHVADELRVAFVAVTRARERLYLTYSRRRRRGDVLEPRRPSRFLRLVPRDLYAGGAEAA